MWSSADLQTLESIRVGPAEIVYAFVSLAGEPSAVDVALLDPSERHRAVRFVRPLDRDRSVLAHAALRSFLARCLGVELSTVRYIEGAHGKPLLLPALGQLEFNLSHTENLALLAVTREGAIGVDVEQLRQLPDAMSIAETHFSEAERNTLMSLPSREQQAGFFSCWTRKEAVVKATGAGVGYALDSFEVSLAPGSTSALKLYAGRAGPETGISLRDLPAPAGYAAAAAVVHPDGDLLRWRELAIEP